MKKEDNIKVTELGEKTVSETENSSLEKRQKLKKAVIFLLMGIVCLGCLYMIFSPKEKDLKDQQRGINEIVPQASVDAMADDKGKAYERELLNKKQQEERASLTALSDYWNDENQKNGTETANELHQANGQQEAMSSYKNVQHTLGNFYQKDDNESSQLQEEVRSLRSQLAQKETKTSDPVASQIALMEKSYQLAAKYLPAGGKNSTESKSVQDTATHLKKSPGQPVYAATHKVVSALYRKPSDSAFISDLLNEGGRFHTIGSRTNPVQVPNSIKACIEVTQVVSPEGSVRLKLLQDARIRQTVIPKGSLLIALAKFQANRLQLQVSSIAHKGNIIPVELSVYDADGQPGIQLPYSPERSAVTEVVANMRNSGGTSIALSSDTKQQLTSDLSRSVIQGVSGYFAKKVRMLQVTLKAGLEVYLVSKNNLK